MILKALILQKTVRVLPLHTLESSTDLILHTPSNPILSMYATVKVGGGGGQGTQAAGGWQRL